MAIQIHGKTYVTVAERLTEAKANIQSITTEVLYINPLVVVKATVLLKDGTVFTGISGANPTKAIEKMSPFEVAETSAVGRALGFAGYGAVESIASADEMAKSDTITVTVDEPVNTGSVCPIHKKAFKNGQYGWYCPTKLDDGKWCKQKPHSVQQDAPVDQAMEQQLDQWGQV